MRQRDMAERKTARARKRAREREKRKRDNVRGKEKREQRREELTSSLCPSFVLPLLLKAEGEKKRKRRRISQRKEGGRDERMKSSPRPSPCLFLCHDFHSLCLPDKCQMDRHGRGTGVKEPERTRETHKTHS